MPESVYRFTEVVGTSTESWERAATVAVETAARTLRDLRVAQVEQLDMVIEDGRVSAYRAKVSISFKLQVESG
jgi:flavin-binding protein dodecin